MSSARPFVVAFFVGVLSAIAGLLLVGWLADQSVAWYSISSFEGGAGYFVVFLALGGGIAGFFIGVIGSWWATTRGATFARCLALVLAVDVGLVAIATLLAWGLADHPPTIDGRPLVVEVELMTPEGSAPVDVEGFRSSLAVMTMDGDTGGYGSLEKDAARAEGARWIIRASVPLETSVPQKQIWVSWTEGEALYFPLPLRSRPTADDFAWSDWRGPSTVYRDGKWIEGDDLPDFRIRTRAQLEPPPEPPPTEAEVAAERDRAEAAALAAVPADAPLAAWLPFTRVDVSEARRVDVLTRIAARPNLRRPPHSGRRRRRGAGGRGAAPRQRPANGVGRMARGGARRGQGPGGPHGTRHSRGRGRRSVLRVGGGVVDPVWRLAARVAPAARAARRRPQRRLAGHSAPGPPAARQLRDAAGCRARGQFLPAAVDRRSAAADRPAAEVSDALVQRRAGVRPRPYRPCRTVAPSSAIVPSCLPALLPGDPPRRACWSG
jgi:hypothetical protein